MTGIDRIIERILSDAKAEGESIEKNAQKECQRMREEQQAKANVRLESVLQKANADAAEKTRRMISISRLETRKKELAAKQQVLNQAFEKALNSLNELDEFKYREIALKLAEDACEVGDEILLVSADSKKVFSEDFFAQLNSNLCAKGIIGKVRPSYEAQNIQKGFIISRNGMELNYSFDAIIKQWRKEMEAPVARILFD